MEPLNVWTVLLFLTAVNGYSLNVTRQLMKDLMKDYDKNIRPVSEQYLKMNVSLTAYMKSIQEFDEVREIFAYSGGFTLQWIDAGMVWNPADYGGIYSVKVSYKKMWVPELVLATPSDDIDTLGKEWQLITYMANGWAIWSPVGLLKSVCSVNVAKYPFDRQVCKSEFFVWGYDVDEVELFTTSSTVDTSAYSGNLAWELDSTNVYVDKAWTSQTTIEFHVHRKAGYIVVNILMPIMFLGMINVLVFLLIPESGERVSFCITVLLSIAVFMTIVSDTLPRSSDPMPFISYKLMLDMVISSLITLVTILNLRLYHKDEAKPIPKWLISVYTLLCRSRLRTGETMHPKIHPTQTEDTMVLTNVDQGDIMDPDAALSTISVARRRSSLKATPSSAGLTMKRSSLKVKPDSLEARLESLISTSGIETMTVTWRDISTLVDCVALITFTTMSVLSFAVFIIFVNI